MDCTDLKPAINDDSGLFKKAHELSVLTGAQVCVIVFSQQDRLFTYGSDEAVNIVDKFTGAGTAYEAKGPQDVCLSFTRSVF